MQDYKVFVVGHIRSGTSMMTRIVDLLGVKMIYDDGSGDPQIVRMGKGGNKYGYFMVTKDHKEAIEAILKTPYSGCKIIFPFMDKMLSTLLRKTPCKVILMKRDPAEIAISMERWNLKEGKSVAGIRGHLAFVSNLLESYGIPFISVSYTDVIEAPEREIGKVKGFIESDADMSEAVKFVDPTQYRSKEGK